MSERLPQSTRDRTSERGAALAMVIFSAAILLVLGLAIGLETTMDEKVSFAFRSNVGALYVAESTVEVIIEVFSNPALFTDTHATYGGESPYAGASQDFFGRRSTRNGYRSFFNDFGLSQFADTNNDGVVDTSADDPALLYVREADADQASFLDSLYMDSWRRQHVTEVSIFAPPSDPVSGKSVGIATVRVIGVSDQGQRIIEQVLVPTLGSPGLSGFSGRALEAGSASGWAGNPTLIHWGDVLIEGAGDLGNNLDKIVEKDSTTDDGDDYAAVDNSTLRGNGGEDRWTDILVTGEIVNPAKDYEGALDCRPFDGLDCLVGDETDQAHGNLAQNNLALVSITNLDYYRYRALAQSYGTYYRSDAAGFIHLDGTGPAEAFTDVTNGNSFRVFFVDTIDGNPPASDGSNMATIPMNGLYFSRGIFYINGTIDTGGLGNETDILAYSPPWDPDLLDPTESKDSSLRIAVANLPVHIDGLLYVVGSVSGSGNPNVYGSIIARGGYTGNGNPEIWFNWEILAGDLSRFDIDPVVRGARREIYK